MIKIEAASLNLKPVIFSILVEQSRLSQLPHMPDRSQVIWSVDSIYDLRQKTSNMRYGITIGKGKDEVYRT